ncbi:T3SS regulon translocated regulator ExsE2 [Vibrio europaeus]|uniref:T3SS regulon translocated regulator ExsE2 n=1 Tax=Vibrio europaeus TaxID=300876 RepID=A0A178JF01_9VIBR|nr:T3SS regulon translocated regulator ExsE2 [Vibrio europaeus]MDC5707102.1 T3SS regulon translocated regulator ExsE2 [Vibrio europaeus]MDC5712467.1 T3SS regulon translocated regulator ExsE2 [Vibrio europaeus]MDC5717110.1 T3SS regulon translocated regulator ExsE2 [Vibrio europaeus]MDC5721356.1 T3SS regulon translocated regulator ExsE2 [Vibrio europaeus]MDC5726410.1 T3SS regulon translocated regulator ExsE2 [Vibrio europaeus]
MPNDIQPNRNNAHAYTVNSSTESNNVSKKTFCGRSVSLLSSSERRQHKAQAKITLNKQLNQLSNTALSNIVLSDNKQFAIDSLYKRKVEIL